MSYIIGICGASASGKSSFLRGLKERLGEECSIVSLDNYYKSISEQFVDEAGEVNFDLPTAVDRDEFFNDILQLIGGFSIERPEYKFNDNSATPQIVTVSPAPIIIVEGLYIYYFKEVVELLDLSLFIDAPENVRFDRRMKRDIQERGIQKNIVEYQWKNHVLPGYEEFIAPYVNDVDVTIDNTHEMESALEELSKKILLEKDQGNSSAETKII